MHMHVPCTAGCICVTETAGVRSPHLILFLLGPPRRHGWGSHSTYMWPPETARAKQPLLSDKGSRGTYAARYWQGEAPKPGTATAQFRVPTASNSTPTTVVRLWCKRRFYWCHHTPVTCWVLSAHLVVHFHRLGSVEQGMGGIHTDKLPKASTSKETMPLRTRRTVSVP